MFWWLAVAPPRTRWLFSAGWAFVWSLGYAAATLTPLGAHGYRWWVPIIGFTLLMALAIAVLTMLLDRSTASGYRAVLDGLTSEQRRQVGRVWGRGPVPTDPAVLTAALRLHDLLERQRQGNRRRRITGVVLVGIATVMLVATAISQHHTVSGSAVLFLLLGVMMVAAPTATALRARRQQPRLAQLRAAAQSEPTVAATVSRPTPPVPSVTGRHRLQWAAAVVTIAVIYVGALVIAMELTPHRAGCRAVNAAVKEIYQDRNTLLTANAVAPNGPPLSQFQQWADSLRRHAAEAASDPATAPRLDRIADLAAQAVTLVDQARRDAQTNSLSATDRQSTYLDIVSQLVAEEGAAQGECRR